MLIPCFVLQVGTCSLDYTTSWGRDALPTPADPTSPAAPQACSADACRTLQRQYGACEESLAMFAALPVVSTKDIGGKDWTAPTTLCGSLLDASSDGSKPTLVVSQNLQAADVDPQADALRKLGLGGCNLPTMEVPAAVVTPARAEQAEAVSPAAGGTATRAAPEVSAAEEVPRSHPIAMGDERCEELGNGLGTNGGDEGSNGPGGNVGADASVEVDPDIVAIFMSVGIGKAGASEAAAAMAAVAAKRPPLPSLEQQRLMLRLAAAAGGRQQRPQQPQQGQQPQQPGHQHLQQQWQQQKHAPEPEQQHEQQHGPVETARLSSSQVATQLLADCLGLGGPTLSPSDQARLTVVVDSFSALAGRGFVPRHLGPVQYTSWLARHDGAADAWRAAVRAALVPLAELQLQCC
jgi:hypothetical protein